MTIHMSNNSSYLLDKFAKVKVYYDTFVAIPSNDIMFFLFGNGLGNYCSRAALTCSGYYSDIYNSFFSPTSSLYMQEYILPKLKNSYLFPESDFGSILYRPYSTILAITGEFGIIGLLLCFLVCLIKYLRSNNYIRLAILIFVSACFFENFLEYSKIIIILGILVNLELKRPNVKNLMRI